MFGFFKLQQPQNLPVLSYAPGTADCTALKILKDMKSTEAEIPLFFGEKEVRMAMEDAFSALPGGWAEVSNITY